MSNSRMVSSFLSTSSAPLSLEAALPPRPYDNPDTQAFHAKQIFHKRVRRYFQQLTEGCHSVDCPNRFCASCKQKLILQPAAAGVMAVYLASLHPRHHFCQPPKLSGAPLPVGLFGSLKGKTVNPSISNILKPREFPFCVFATSPFSTLFEKPLSSSCHVITSPSKPRINRTATQNKKQVQKSTEEYSLPYFTLSLLRQTVQNYHSTSDSSLLINSLRTVFSSFSALRNSFVCEDVNKTITANLDDAFQAF
eukprot:m.259790 g.259790  ORF g.259790 m.259790 type:complete len:251 (-) comp26774_c0_seq39:1844-2596(-)